MTWPTPARWLRLVFCLLLTAGAAIAQLPPRGVTPTPPRGATPTPRPATPVPVPPTPATTPTPTGIWTQWRVTVEYRETPDGPWKTQAIQHEEGPDRKTVTLTLWRHR